MLDAVSLERRQLVPRTLAAMVFVGSVATALSISALVLVAAGVPASALAEELIVQVFLTADGLAQTLTGAIPLVLVGLAAVAAFRLGFWNIGLEGQLWVGAIAATAAAVGDTGPPGIRLAVMLLLAFAAGMAWVVLPLALKLRIGVSEVVVTLMLTSIAYLLLQHVLFGPLRDAATNFPVSSQLDAGERLVTLGWGKLHTGLWVAVAAAASVAVLTQGTRLGFYARVIGSGPTVALAAGLPVAATSACFVLLSGGLAGLAGGVIVAGTEYRLTQFVGTNATFSGIVVAVLARLDPLAVLPAAFLVAGLYVAGATLKVFYGISEGVVLLIQGIVLMTLLVGQFFATFRIDFRRSAAAR